MKKHEAIEPIRCGGLVKAIHTATHQWIFGSSTPNREYIELGDGSLRHVIRYTVSRCTGFSDKRGVTIYEHDTLLTPAIGEGVVVMSGGHFIIRTDYNAPVLLCDIAARCEVTGNIYD